jgi:polyhydroxybutyrate depolymerase
MPTPAAAGTNPLVAARPYRLTTPSTVDPAKSYPLVLVLHGLGGNGEAIEQYYQLDPLASELGFLVAYPEGSEQTVARRFWTRRLRFWNATDGCCDFYGSGVDDVAYLDSVIEDVSARHRVDPKRIFVVGLSNGGYMAYRYACDRAGRVAAIVSHAGAMWLDAGRCKPSEPVAVLEIHGTADQRVPYDGKAQGAQGATDGLAVPSAHQSVADWAIFDACGSAADASGAPLDLVAGDEGPGIPEAETTVERWTGCRGVELWSMHGAPHRPRLNQPLWARTVYGWLAAHPKP